MRRKAQIGFRHGIALPAEILLTHDIPQPKSNIKSAVCQGQHAACDNRIGTFLPPARQVGARAFVSYKACGIDAAEHAAAFKISLDDAANFLRRLRFAFERGNGNRQLSHANSRHFHTELGKCRKGHSCACGQQADNASTTWKWCDAHGSSINSRILF